MLRNKVAVVTGASKGIGKAIALKLFKMGATVCVLDIEEASNQDNEESKYKFYQCDVADSQSTNKVFKAIKDDFGQIDILVNNAGITKDKLVLSMKEDDFDKVLSVNLKGCFNTIKEVYPLFMRQKSGKIINISSISGIMGNSGQANYAASKGGLIALTKSVAKELASRGICCNAVAPGFIETDMTENTPLNPDLINNVPLKRMGKPEEVAELVGFLASPNSDYITGTVIQIDGGLAM